jgi:DNA-binding NarL/FixJ family response regulator
MKKIKILIADDEVLFRSGIAFLLQKEDNIEVVFEASTGTEIMHYLKTSNNKTDIILMDLRMPELNGVEATKLITKDYPDIKIIALTSYDTKAFVVNMLKVGAVSYLVKNVTPAEVVKTINIVYNKGYHYNAEVLKLLHEEKFIPSAELSKELDEDLFLSAREKEVLRLLCFQYATDEIAAKLSISKRTIEGHRYNLLLKTRCKNVVGLLLYALQNKIINLDELVLETTASTNVN